MTAHARKEDKDKCLSAGMDDYISKPVSVKDISETLGRIPIGGNMEDREDHEEEDIIFDYNAFYSRMEGNMDIITKTLKLSLIDYEYLFAKLRHAIDRGKSREVCLYAHSAKGISANISAGRLKQASYELEIASKNKDTGKWKELFCVMKERFDEVKEEAWKFV